MCVFFFKQDTAYGRRIIDWGSDVCSSDLFELVRAEGRGDHRQVLPLALGVGEAQVDPLDVVFLDPRDDILGLRSHRRCFLLAKWSGVPGVVGFSLSASD